MLPNTTLFCTGIIEKLISDTNGQSFMPASMIGRVSLACHVSPIRSRCYIDEARVKQGLDCIWRKADAIDLKLHKKDDRMQEADTQQATVTYVVDGSNDLIAP